MMSSTSKARRDEAPDRPDQDGRDGSRQRKGEPHPAGPHADERLTDDAKTPGTGALPEKEPAQKDVDAGSG
jgi:hypothetical protein